MGDVRIPLVSGIERDSPEPYGEDDKGNWRTLYLKILVLFTNGSQESKDISEALGVHLGTIQKRLAEMRKNGKLPKRRMTTEECRELDNKVVFILRSRGNIGAAKIARLLNIPERRVRSSLDRVTGARRRRERAYKEKKRL